MRVSRSSLWPHDCWIRRCPSGISVKDNVVKVRIKSEVWQEQARVKTAIVALDEVDYKADSRELINALSAM